MESILVDIAEDADVLKSAIDKEEYLHPNSVEPAAGSIQLDSDKYRESLLLELATNLSLALNVEYLFDLGVE
ncbi:hypothetical protein WICPIJ_005223 [Wickerhamomyces pijperi]|uniref:Uncharacterized protein n=1 Tax=Wickerhamomyces pijperi TaxID=599730 RepID=A0A9P8Q3Z9_WICPI|nr:hypothetical protein WICPIJ_005223 [Wickerhamomyces pijperi]